MVSESLVSQACAEEVNYLLNTYYRMHEPNTLTKIMRKICNKRPKKNKKVVPKIEPELQTNNYICDICLNDTDVKNRIVIKCDSKIPHTTCDLCYVKIMNMNGKCPFCRNIIKYEPEEIVELIIRLKFDNANVRNKLLKKYLEEYINDTYDRRCGYCIFIFMLTVFILIGLYGYFMSNVRFVRMNN
jgi:hypothetical protein